MIMPITNSDDKSVPTIVAIDDDFINRLKDDARSAYMMAEAPQGQTTVPRYWEIYTSHHCLYLVHDFIGGNTDWFYKSITSSDDRIVKLGSILDMTFQDAKEKSNKLLLENMDKVSQNMQEDLHKSKRNMFIFIGLMVVSYLYTKIFT